MQIQAFYWWEVCGLLAAFNAFVRSVCNSTSLALSPSDHAVGACAYCCVPSCHFIVAFGFDCFRVVLFKECIVYQRLERHSGCRECASSSTVIKKVQETGCSLQNHAVLPQQLSSDTQGLIHKTELQALKGSPSERSQSVLEVSYPGSQREKDTFAILGVSASAL